MTFVCSAWNCVGGVFKNTAIDDDAMVKRDGIYAALECLSLFKKYSVFALFSDGNECWVVDQPLPSYRLTQRFDSFTCIVKGEIFTHPFP